MKRCASRAGFGEGGVSWNVKGLQFFQLHELFDTLAAAVADDSDLIAERATALGCTALGTARMAAAASRFPEYPLDAVDGRQHVEALTACFANLANTSRAAIAAAAAFGDADTADVFTEVSRCLDKHLGGCQWPGTVWQPCGASSPCRWRACGGNIQP